MQLQTQEYPKSKMGCPKKHFGSLLCLIIIKLMSRLPLLRGKTQVRFSNPLAGRVYDNTKYQKSCFFAQEEAPEQGIKVFQKSQSAIYYSLRKDGPKPIDFELPSEMKPDSLTKTSKVFNFSKRMLKLYTKKCAKNHNPSIQSSNPQTTEESVPRKERESSPQFFKINPKKFDQIEVIVLQLFSEGRALITQQNQQKKFKVNLGRYFQLFFKDKAAGVLFMELSDLVQRYIDDIIAQQSNQLARENNGQRFNINNKRLLYQKLLQLHRCGNRQELKEVIKFYCIPRPETRQIFLKDLLSLITKMLHEQFHFSKYQQYCLLNKKGEKITDFAQIKFSTKQLFVAQQNQVQTLYHQYFSHVQQLQFTQQKKSFRQTLKHYFRHQVAQGLYEQNPIFEKPFVEQRVEKKNNLSRAQQIIGIKNAKYSEGRQRFKELLEMHKTSPRKPNALELKDQGKLKNQQERYVSTEEKLMVEFKRLKIANDYQNPEFKNNESNKNKIQFGTIAKESPYFKSKSQQQIQRIFDALSFAQTNSSSSFNTQIVTLEDYVSLRKIIACSAERQSIMNFVDRYLSYDEYGQLQKQELKKVLAFVIGGQKKTTEVILLTIWSWLQKNGVIINDGLSQSNMQLLYQRNKVVYYLLISLIFGTNQTTVLELAEQILI